MQLKASGSYCLFQLWPEFAPWLKESYLKLSFSEWEYPFLCRRSSDIWAWKVWVRCSLQPRLLLPSSFSCPYLMGRRHSAKKDNADRKVRSTDENLFCWYCCCHPPACCPMVLPFALRSHLNPAEKKCFFSIRPHETQLLFPYILDSAASCLMLVELTITFLPVWKFLWWWSPSCYQVPAEAVLMTVFPLLWDSLCRPNLTQFPGIHLSDDLL